MILFAKFNYVLEVMLAELIFLYVYPRQSRFPFRLFLALIVSLAAGYVEYILRTRVTALISFLGMLIVLAVTMVGMYCSFKGSFLSILSSCAAGVALQHISHHISRLIALLPSVGQWNALTEFMTCLLLDGIAILILMGPLKKSRYYENYTPQITTISLLIVLLCTGVTRFLRLSGMLNLYATICTSLYAIVCCLLALLIQFSLYYFVCFKSEYLLLQRIREEEGLQYEMSRENFELLNIKCHDLKHKLLSLESQPPQAELDSMREIIDSYDGTYHTGLGVLDVALNEKALRCRNRNITLTYMGPGIELSFMDVMDVYSLFGNILENAITAADKAPVPEKRIVSMIIEHKGDFVLISTINYLNDMLSFVDGLPCTTKEGESGYHGYGLKSVQAIAKKYNGDITVSVEEGLFQLNVYLMKG